MKEIVTIGETMVSFSPSSPGPLRYIRGFESRIAGAESNLAIGAAKLGHTAAWISALGEDEFGHFVENSIRAEGVDTGCVTYDAFHRTGVMFKQVQAAGETSVFYYRENSAASHMTPSMVPESCFSGAKLFHATGITPVLSRQCLDTLEHCISMARENGVLFSFDPNIRKKLWGQQDFSPLISSLTLRADLVLMGLEEAKALFGLAEIPRIMDLLFTKGQAKWAAVKNGASGAYVSDGTETIFLPPYPCICVDPIGAGDAFNAAFLCGILEGKSLDRCGQMAAAAGAMATETCGDMEGYPTASQLNAILKKERDIYR